jgi:opacity protein-like surface antigen
MRHADLPASAGRIGRHLRMATVLSALLPLFAAPAAAQGDTASATGWQVTLTPYLWFAGVSGDASLPRQTRDFDASFGDILSDLQVGAMGTLEVRRGRFGILVDAFTLTLEQDISTPRSVLFRGGDARLTTTELSVLGLVRVVEEQGWNLDLGAGLRSWWIDSKISLNSGLAAGRSASGSANVTDPILALRFNTNLSDRIGLTAYADIGGFDTGSRLTWQALGALNWRVTDSITAHLGYRHISLDLARGSVDLDITLSGPVAGVSFRF